MYDNRSLRRDIQTLFNFIDQIAVLVNKLEEQADSVDRTAWQNAITEEAFVALSEELEAIRKSQRRVPHIEGIYLFDEVSTSDDNENGPILDLRALEGFDSLVEYVLNEHASNTRSPIPVGGVRVSKHLTKLQAEPTPSRDEDEDEAQKNIHAAREVLRTISALLDSDYDYGMDDIAYVLKKARKNLIF